MSEKYKFRDPEGLYFTTTTTVGWIDVFTRPELKHIVVRSLKHCQEEKGLVIHGWCLMPSHLHMIVRTEGEPLPGIMRDFKKFTSKALIKAIDQPGESRREWILKLFEEEADTLRRAVNYKVWQDGNHPILLTKGKFTMQRLEYIHNNPVVEEIVTEGTDYLYSSARNYNGGKGLIEIELLGLISFQLTGSGINASYERLVGHASGDLSAVGLPKA